MTTAGLDHKYLRLADLRRLRHLVFASRRVVDGHYAGRHASPRRGHSVEFNDYRQYMPGDEVGDVDWKVFGRTDKLFIKLYEHQSNMTVNLLVDASASMAYRGLDDRGESKYDLACRLAAAIAFLTTQQQDRVSLGLAAEGLTAFQPPAASGVHLRTLLDIMASTKPNGEARLADALRKMAGAVTRKGVMVVFSDLLDPLDEVMRGLAILTHRGTEVILFHILHADELHLPPVDDAVFVDAETSRRIALNVPDIRQQYDRRVRQLSDAWRQAGRCRCID